MIFIDMDGTLAKMFSKPNYLEKMYEQGFFAGLKPYAWVQQLNEFCKDRKDVFILSACVDTEYCEKEKIFWLKTYLPNIPLDNYIFTKVGENKAEKVVEKLGEKADFYILVDDYSKNIYDWQMYAINFIGVKFLNGINNKGDNYYPYKIRDFKGFKALVNDFDTRE
jgi:5'(3')-deoxyribonucleotidase